MVKARPHRAHSCEIETTNSPITPEYLMSLILELQAKVAKLEAPTLPTDGYMTIDQAAFHSGYKRSNINNLIRHNKIVAVKKGGSVRVQVTTLDIYLEKKRMTNKRTKKTIDGSLKSVEGISP